MCAYFNCIISHKFQRKAFLCTIRLIHSKRIATFQLRVNNTTAFDSSVHTGDHGQRTVRTRIELLNTGKEYSQRPCAGREHTHSGIRPNSASFRVELRIRVKCRESYRQYRLCLDARINLDKLTLCPCSDSSELAGTLRLRNFRLHVPVNFYQF